MNTTISTTLRRRAFIAQAAALTLLPATWAHAADPWPQRTIKWVVPYLAGTGPDTTARIVAEAVSKELGQSVIIENRGGVGGNLGARQVAKAAPDGYTWIYSGSPMAASMRSWLMLTSCASSTTTKSNGGWLSAASWCASFVNMAACVSTPAEASRD